MNTWRWRTIAAAAVAGAMVLVVSFVTVKLVADENSAATQWLFLTIPIGTLLSVFILPGIIAALVVVHGMRQELIDRRFDERRNR